MLFVPMSRQQARRSTCSNTKARGTCSPILHGPTSFNPMMLSLFGSECSPSLRSIGRDSVMTFGFASQRLRVRIS